MTQPRPPQPTATPRRQAMFPQARFRNRLRGLRQPMRISKRPTPLVQWPGGRANQTEYRPEQMHSIRRKRGDCLTAQSQSPKPLGVTRVTHGVHSTEKPSPGSTRAPGDVRCVCTRVPIIAQPVAPLRSRPPFHRAGPRLHRFASLLKCPLALPPKEVRRPVTLKK